MGSEHPVALQTMTTTDTRDVEGTVEQVVLGCLLGNCEPVLLRGYWQGWLGSQREGCCTEQRGCWPHRAAPAHSYVPLLPPQVKRCADAGADIVRITVQGLKEAEACGKIRDRLFQDKWVGWGGVGWGEGEDVGARGE